MSGQETFHRHEAADGVDVGKGPDGEGTLPHGHLNHRASPSNDVILGVLPLEVPRDLDRLLERLREIGAHHVP